MVLKKVHRVIKFNQNAWLKPDIDMNTDLRKKQKVTLKKIIYLNKFIKKFIKNHFFKKKNSLYIMIKSLSLAEEHTIKDIRNLFRLKTEQITLSVE